jgi:hypothetical protein
MARSNKWKIETILKYHHENPVEYKKLVGLYIATDIKYSHLHLIVTASRPSTSFLLRKKLFHQPQRSG